jgi:hypothetical protein
VAQLLKLSFASTLPLRREAERHYQENGNWPSSAAQLGLDTASSMVDEKQGVSVAIDVRSGAQITLTFGGGPLDGQSLLISPRVDGGRVIWLCFSPGLQNSLLPPECGAS